MKTNKLIGLIFLVLISNLVYSKTYCFEQKISLFQIKKKMQKDVLLPDEGVVLDTATGCIEVAIRPYRESFVDKYIRMNFPLNKLKMRSSIPVGGMCRFKVKKVSRKKVDGSKNQVGTRTEVSRFKEREEGESVSEVMVMEGRPGTISVDDINVFVKCRKVHGNQFDLTFSLTQSFKSKLSSSVVISSNQWLNIGSVHRDLNSKKKNISSRTGVDYTKQEGSQNFDYLISVN